MQVLDGRYELGDQIGGGGMADVFEAADRKLDRRVAVKLLRDGTADPRARERFIREARMAAGLVHPNVVTVYDVGEADGRPYLVMELVEGQTLAALLAARGPLEVGAAVVIEDGILAALGAAHRRGLVHRDVKPGNVLLARDGRVKLADFGIAKATRELSAALTATGQVLGTPSYLSPEQVAGEDATSRSDVYAAGVVLYEMLAGSPPFTGEHPVAVAVAHQREPVPSLAAHRPDLPVSITRVVSRALEKDPARRFADADEMRAALKGERVPPSAATTTALATGAATRTLPPRPAPVAEGGSRRRALLAGVVAAALIGGAVLAAVVLSSGSSSGPGEQLAPATSATAASTTPTTAAPTTTTLPSTLAGLVSALAADPTAYGPKGEDLLRTLQEVAAHPDPNGKKAAKAAEKIGEWVSEGQLDPTVGARAQQLLGAAAENAAPPGRGHGHGKAGGKD